MAGLSPNSSPIITPAASPTRAAPSSLFLGSPSANTSNLSLPSTSTKPVRTPLLRSRSTRAPEPAKKSISSVNTNVAAGGSNALGRSARGSGVGSTAPQQPAEADRTDALWAEMQATLAEVEISALSGTHVFGEAHSQALEELRRAQIALAVAWGRGEADEEDDDQAEAKAPGGRDASKSGTGAGEGTPYGIDDDEADIREARRRREANERFFKRVGEGVVDVVGRLEGVAQAMAKVEKESREIWRDGESIDSGSDPRALDSPNVLLPKTYFKTSWQRPPSDIFSHVYTISSSFRHIRVSIKILGRAIRPDCQLLMHSRLQSNMSGVSFMDSIILVLVGPNETPFKVSKYLLCRYSEYCRAALSGFFKEGQDRMIRLEDEDPEFFNAFVQWLYDGSLPKPHALESLDQWNWYLSLYTLADRTCTYGLQNKIIDTMITLARLNRRMFFTTAWKTWDRVPPRCKLREFLLDCVEQQAILGPPTDITEAEDTIDGKDFLAEFGKRILLTHLPSKHDMITIAIDETHHCKRYHVHPDGKWVCEDDPFARTTA